MTGNSLLDTLPIESLERLQRHLEPVGADAQDAAEKARIKQAELAAMRNGIIPQPQVAESIQDRTALPEARSGGW